MLTQEYYDVILDGTTYPTRIRTWGRMQRNITTAHGPYKLVPVDHKDDHLAVLVEDSDGRPVGYLPRPDPQDLRGRVRDTLRSNRIAIMRMSQDTTVPLQMELELKYGDEQ